MEYASYVSSVSRLSSRAAAMGGMEEDKLRRYKTVMCQRMSGPEGCKYGVHCDLSVNRRTHTQPHDEPLPLLSSSLPLSPVICVCLCCAAAVWLCWRSAHTADELRRSLSGVAYAPVLCAVKGCSDPLCKFAHNMAESQYHPDVTSTQQHTQRAHCQSLLWRHSVLCSFCSLSYCPIASCLVPACVGI